MSDNEPFLQQQPRYDGALYELAHLKPLDRTLVVALPRAIWLKVMPGPPGGAMVVAVKSAHLAASPPKGGQPESYRFIIEQTRRTGRQYGVPSSE